MFNHQYNNNLYWDTAEVYYNLIKPDEVYAISCMIVGYNENGFKLMTYLEDVKYYNIEYGVFVNHDQLFFNTYVILHDNFKLNGNNTLEQNINNLKIVKSKSTNSIYSEEIEISVGSLGLSRSLGSLNDLERCAF